MAFKSFFSRGPFHSSACACFHSRRRTVSTATNNSLKAVSIIGSGNWGTAIAKVIANNVRWSDTFRTRVRLYVHEELFNGQRLVDVINNEHENKKYLPGILLPDNVWAVSDLTQATEDADVLVFVMPHQFLKNTCQKMEGAVKPTAVAVSLMKGFGVESPGTLKLLSSTVSDSLNIPCHVLMGANLAGEVAAEKYCEATIGARNSRDGLMLKELFATSYLRLVAVEDAITVELCGALKVVTDIMKKMMIAERCGNCCRHCGWSSTGQQYQSSCHPRGTYGDDKVLPGTKLSTFLESCGVADLITSCYGGRNRRVAEAMVCTRKTIEELEFTMLNGQKLQGPSTAAETHAILTAKGIENEFPLFTAVHRICANEAKPEEFMDCLRNHPTHI